LGTPSFYTQQLFAVYMLILGCISLGFLLNSSYKTTASKLILIKKILLFFVLIFVINSFWILPQIYFLKSNGGWITQSKSNQIATEDTLYQNLEKGTLVNFIRLEGFYFDLKGINNTSLFAPWKDHFSGIFGLLPYAFAGLMILGLLKTIQEKKFEFVLIFVLCATTLLLATPPFSWINQLVRQIPIINQIFRSPFTKFIIPYSLVFSFFVALGIKTIVTKKNSLVYLLICLFIILYSLPSFKGYFISPEMKVKIPSDYIQVMDYFKTEGKDKRIALLPDYTFWGWFFHKWGYNGSGFLWYGIEQPIVSRTFDVWSSKSESYFWEQKQALEAENLDQYEKVLDKYNIDYLILDKSLIPVVSSNKSLAVDRIEDILSKSQKITHIFSGENISLFQVNHLQKINSFVSVASNLPSIGPKVTITTQDQGYLENENYLNNIDFDIYYPFADLTTQTRIKDKKWNLEEYLNSFSVSSKIDFGPNNYSLQLQSNSKSVLTIDQEPVDFKLNFSSTYTDTKIKINFEKLLIKPFDLSKFESNSNEFAVTAPELPQKYGYLIKIRSKNIKGSPLFFYIIDGTKKQSVIEEKLRNETEYFILPNKFEYGLGYSFVFQNKSYENHPSENILEEVSVYLFPYKELKEMKLVKNNLSSADVGFSNDFETKKYGYFNYKVTANSGNIIILNQSFDKGWVAFSDGKILEHVLVNNWANGWKLVASDQWLVNSENKADLTTNHQSLVTIIFWPQYLEFLGFILLGGTFLRILLIKED